MKTTKLEEVRISEWHIITMMKYEQEATEKNYDSISYEIWETNNEFATFETKDLKLAYKKFEEIEKSWIYANSEDE